MSDHLFKKFNQDWTFQQENYPKYVGKSTRECIKKKNFRVIVKAKTWIDGMYLFFPHESMYVCEQATFMICWSESYPLWWDFPYFKMYFWLDTIKFWPTVLEKGKAAIPPALEEWMKYFGVEAQLPTMPKIEFSPVESWNSGVRWTISSLSEAPTKASEYTNQGIQYLKDLTK